MVTLWLEGNPVDTVEQFEHLRQIFPEYERFYIRGKNDDNHLIFTCRYLTEDYKCGDYKGRPQICREYPDQQIMLRGGILVSKCGYSFVPVADFEKYLNKAMIKIDKNNNNVD